MAELLARTLTDDDFRKRLLANPEEVLRAEGISIPPEVKVKVVENTADLIHIVLPAKQEALPDEVLDKVAAGTDDSSEVVMEPLIGPCTNSNCQLEYQSKECLQKLLQNRGSCLIRN